MSARQKNLDNHELSILMINPMDATYGSTHRFRKFYSGLIARGWKIRYMESNCPVKEGGISIKQPNNVLGFLWGSIQRVYYAVTLEYDILFIQTLTPLTIGAIMAARFRSKRIIVDWDDLSWVLQKNALRAILVRFCEHSFLGLADEVLVPNKGLLEYGLAHGARNISMAAHGVDFGLFDPARFQPAVIKEKLGLGKGKVLGFLASFTTGGVADLDIIFQAVKEVKSKVKDINFLVIGGGPLFKNYRDLSKKIGLEDVYFTGLIKQEEAAYYLSCVDIALIFMRDNLKNKMKTSLKVGEYLAMNKVVIGHLCGQTRDDFQQYCLNCQPDVNSFSEAILRHMDKTASGFNPRQELLKIYTWDNSLEVIDSILKNKKR